MRPFKSELLQAQWLRALGHAPTGSAEPGECFVVSQRVQRKGERFDAWYDEWMAMAGRLKGQGDTLLGKKQEMSAKECFMRASNYYRTAYTPLFGSKDEKERERVALAYREHRATFKSAAELFPQFAGVNVKAIEIPFGHIDPKLPTMSGYIFSPADATGPSPTIIVNGGYDSSAEECYLFSGAAAVARGFTAITFDGPGQASSIIEKGVPFRPDWEVVLSAVVDYCVKSETSLVDPDYIGLIGISFGGYMAPRAVCHEKRIKALIADPGELSLYLEFADKLPKLFIRALNAPDQNPIATRVMKMALNRMARNPTKGWAFRRGMYVHGVESPFEYLRLTRDYTSEGIVSSIGCTVMICSAECDRIGRTADALYDQLPSTIVRHRVKFSEAEGAGDHCEGASRSVFNHRAMTFFSQVFADLAAKAAAPAEANNAAPDASQNPTT